jgi:hypothetical protein
MHAKKRRKKSPSSTGNEGEGVSYSDDDAKKYSKVDIMNDDMSNGNSTYPNEPPIENDNDAVSKPKRTTLSGGPSLIFEMARRMLVWDDELYENSMLNDAGSRRGEGNMGSLSTSSSLPPPPEQLAAFPPLSVTSTSSPLLSIEASVSPLPRWRPSAIRQQSISNVNPAFRTSSPIMTNAGYAGILRRNSRKKNKPSMWRYCLRIYNKMGELEKGIAEETVDGIATGDADTTSIGGRRRIKKIKRGVAHHEAALVAASKLGMWEEAILIFRGVELSVSNRIATVATGSNNRTIRRGGDCVTDNMILSVISACVKGSNVKHTASSKTPYSDSGLDEMNIVNGIDANGQTSNTTRKAILPSRPMMRALTVDERRKPLDVARDILLSMEEKHDIPLVSRHINPLASAYNRLGMCSDASALINGHLKDRTPPPPPKKQHVSSSTKSRLWRDKRELVSDNPGFEGVPLVEWNDDSLNGVDASLNVDEDDDDDDLIERAQFNIHEMKSKDRASYSLLVQGAAIEGDWTSAVHELQRMADAGLYPNSRDINSWNEVMERGCRPAGNGVKDAAENWTRVGGRQRRRSWKKKRDGIWLGNLR